MLPGRIADKLHNIKTPFYYYDLSVLKKTLYGINTAAKKYGYIVHYALKANANKKILGFIRKAGLGADCVSGNEVRQALGSGFFPGDIAFAGVGKTDDEITYAIRKNIFCFNCESLQEIEVINSLAAKVGKTAPIALRINPHINPKTHHYITTGLEENKFGINKNDLEEANSIIKKSANIHLVGIHFHIGSQITDLNSFKRLCLKTNEIMQWFRSRNINLDHINMGGGLGINYHHPDEKIPDFASYFTMFNDFLELLPHQKLHFELGRSVVAQCGSLIARTLFVKKGIETNFLVLDAGMTELIRPALYQAYHKIENISALIHRNSSVPDTASLKTPFIKYDVVGPICETSDCFGKAVMLPESRRGDLIAIRSTGAYGEVMASSYNLRKKVQAVYSDEL